MMLFEIENYNNLWIYANIFIYINVISIHFNKTLKIVFFFNFTFETTVLFLFFIN